MTAAERAAMREALRLALGRTLLPDAPLEHPGRMPLPPPDAPDALLDRFRRELIALGGQVHEADDAEAVAELVEGFLAANAGHPRTVLAWDDGELPVPGVGASLEGRGVTVLHQQPGDLASAEQREHLASATVGVTGALAALAETGSVVLASGPGRGRLASLLPLVHVAIVRRTVLMDSLAGLVAREPALFTRGANVVCITGPSRTADIEHTLSRGVHGPRDIHVIFVP